VLEKLGFQYSHKKFFPALQIEIPCYLLPEKQISPDEQGKTRSFLCRPGEVTVTE
jgi:hypothetical protein